MNNFTQYHVHTLGHGNHSVPDTTVRYYSVINRCLLMMANMVIKKIPTQATACLALLSTLATAPRTLSIRRCQAAAKQAEPRITMHLMQCSHYATVYFHLEAATLP